MTFLSNGEILKFIIHSTLAYCSIIPFKVGIGLGFFPNWYELIPYILSFVMLLPVFLELKIRYDTRNEGTIK